MSDNFWARRIQADNPPPPRPQTVPNGPWWASTPQDPQRPLETVQPPQAPARPARGCPGCGSGNYSNVNAQNPRAIHPLYRCFDCGYPVVQSTSGMGNHSGSGVKGTPARQITEMTVTSETGRVLGKTEAASGRFNNYHPKDTRAGNVS